MKLGWQWCVLVKIYEIKNTAKNIFVPKELAASPPPENQYASQVKNPWSKQIII